MADKPKTQEEVLKRRIVFNQNIFGTRNNYNLIIQDLLEDSKYIALATLFPYEDYSAMELPTKHNNWQIRACIELYNMADKAMFVNYKENGIDFQKLSDGLSISLMNELIPRVGIPKRKESV